MFKIFLLVVFAALSNGKTRPPVQITNHDIFVYADECEAALPQHERLVRQLYRDQSLKSIQAICTEYKDPERKAI